MGAYLDCEADPGKVRLTLIEDHHIQKLEDEIDQMEEELAPLKNFILPGGHPSVSQCHVARCVCRRAERNVITLNEYEKISGTVIRYLNRLSDYLFVLARKLTKDAGIPEIIWTARK